MNRYLKDLSEIFHAGVQRVEPRALTEECLSLDGPRLRIDTPAHQYQLDLSDYRHIFIIGAGKAAASMARGIEKKLGHRITEGTVVVKYHHTEPLDRCEILEAGHPIPDRNSLQAANKILDIASRAGSTDLVIALLSGGGSSLMAAPYTSESICLTLAEKQQATDILLKCGASIGEINCIRKHLSMIKGGRLAEHIFPATCLGLILSDVVGDHPDVIASGPAAPDQSTFDDMRRILEKYDLTDKMPESVVQIMKGGLSGLIPETPASTSEVFRQVHHIVIGSNLTCLKAAAARAEALGYRTTIVSSQVTGESREIAKFYYGLAKDAAMRRLAFRYPACFIFGGETTVTVTGKGKGGRNQEMALAFLAEMKNDLDARQGTFFLAASTDGSDGPTDAAGAFASLDIRHAAENKNLDIDRYLRNNDAYRFFSQSGNLFKTGPTKTNVCDIQILIVT